MVVITDYKPCLALQHSVTLNRRFRRMLLRLQEWSLELRYKARRRNVRADALLRQWDEQSRA